VVKVSKCESEGPIQDPAKLAMVKRKQYHDEALEVLKLGKT